MSDEDLIEAMEMWDDHGYVYGKCSVCGAESGAIEPDASDYECEVDGCDGKVSSPLILAGVI